MREEETVVGEPLAGDSVESRQDAGGTKERDAGVTGERDVDTSIEALKASHAEEVKVLREEIADLRDAVKEVLSLASEEVSGPVKTAGVRSGRSGARSVLASAALAARESGSRGDVQEYMRVRRGRV